jgi:YVTN family beta-propeller protein
MDRSIRAPDLRSWFVALGLGVASAMCVAPVRAQELCGGVDYPFPYTDVSGVGPTFCPGIMEAYVTGVSKGTTPSTFSPNETVTRVQMTTFLQRSLDQGLTRASRRAALSQWWAPQNTNSMQTIAFASMPYACAADGENVWTATANGQVIQTQASTGISVNNWTGATNGFGVVVAAGKVFVIGLSDSLYVIDPTLAPGMLTSAATLGTDPQQITFDGTSLWTANFSGSVSIITLPTYAVSTVTTGFSQLTGIVYDGAHIWVADGGAGTLLKLDAAGAILQTVPVGSDPIYLAFDGANIWVPNLLSNSITVVQASSGAIVATISKDANNMLDGPLAASFDGERILVSNTSNNTVTVFKAADLSVIANVSTGSLPGRACSDGINFWIPSSNGLLRF